MFRITKDPSSGSDNLYLTEIIYNGSVVLIMCVVGVWRHAAKHVWSRLAHIYKLYLWTPPKLQTLYCSVMFRWILSFRKHEVHLLLNTSHAVCWPIF